MTDRSVLLSKIVSHALRHAQWLYELEPDDGGWVALDELVDALRRDPAWSDLTAEEVADLTTGQGKRRHEVSHGRVRALYGHSLPGRILKRHARPPALLFHGTSGDAVANILSSGLLPYERQYVHLSVDRETAVAVGRRKGASVALLLVNTDTATRSGVVFLEGTASVWLTEHVPPEHLTVVQGPPPQ
jgi:putative RNA 2'-phosphotransferase